MRESNEERISQAIILAAGEGQRLKPFTKLMPKVMLNIAHKPILQYVIEALAQNGIRRVVMIVGYRKEHVQDYFGSGSDFGMEIKYVTQPQQLGTAHALKHARDLADDRFLLISGDNMIEADTIAPLIKTKSNTMLIRAHEDISRYGVVIVSDGLVKEVIEKPEEKVSSLINTGMYVLDKDIFDFIGDEVRLTSVIQRMISQGYAIVAQHTAGVWLDAAYPWDILKLNDLTLGKISTSIGGTIEDGAIIKGLVSIGDGTIIRGNCYIVGPVAIGTDCEIGPSTCIFPATSIGNSVSISPFSVIRNSSIGSNVTIGPSSSIQDSIIASGTTVGTHFAARSGDATVKVENEYNQVKMGAIVGNYSEIGDNTVIEPGTIIGNNCRINAMKVISENIPDGGLVV
ncbi:MAG: NTP transferase domain-containing protein [Chloroflexi bacterium]|jgi:UDP-N-acetylglucosamine diphosphorylase / glucose-1-phosphate thymidylyltransferase / UDP-N-acetylgalactosamine diphosphorylase / glucosamine-1-phosphate N-acetyltransferase / galactosamine-1-phosphate N-acetyltransferase|nr:NTP transferase domain-containing protein [Chloroflexota bacterium]